MSTSYGRAGCIDAVWEKGTPIPGKDPKRYRLDYNGSLIYKSSYGKTTEMGWEIDHIIPQSRGGSNDITNLRPVHYSINRSRGNKME